MAANVAIVVLLAVVLVVAVRVARKRSVQGSACCGTHESAPARIKVADRNKGNYPYVTELGIGGMTCANCAIRVQNALNGLPDTWATVNIDTHTATVRTKQKPNQDEMRTAVLEAGYVVL